MTDHNRRNRPGDFDMGFLVPGLPFFEDIGQSLSDLIYRLFDRMSRGFDRLRERTRPARAHSGPELHPLDRAVSPLPPLVDTPDTEKN